MDNRIPVFVDYGGPSPEIDPTTHVLVNYIEPGGPTSLQSTETEHREHPTDGRWHDDCPECMQRRQTYIAKRLEQVAKQPCLLSTEDRDCPPCQASKALEERHAAGGAEVREVRGSAGPSA